MAAAGWTLLRPIPYSPSLPRPAETPQYQQLVKAVLAYEHHEIDRLLAAGHSQASLQGRLDRANAGQVGAVVPTGVNDYVAYRPGQPTLTVLIIPHPPYATRSFWTRKPEPGRQQPAQRGRRDSRVDRYERLATILPVVAVFASEEIARQYEPLLTQAGFAWSLVSNIADRLTRLTASANATDLRA